MQMYLNRTLLRLSRLLVETAAFSLVALDLELHKTLHNAVDTNPVTEQKVSKLREHYISQPIKSRSLLDH
jgi:hypothetical protein